MINPIELIIFNMEFIEFIPIWLMELLQPYLGCITFPLIDLFQPCLEASFSL